MYENITQKIEELIKKNNIYYLTIAIAERAKKNNQDEKPILQAINQIYEKQYSKTLKEEKRYNRRRKQERIENGRTKRNPQNCKIYQPNQPNRSNSANG